MSSTLNEKDVIRMCPRRNISNFNGFRTMTTCTPNLNVRRFSKYFLVSANASTVFDCYGQNISFKEFLNVLFFYSYNDSLREHNDMFAETVVEKTRETVVSCLQSVFSYSTWHNKIRLIVPFQICASQHRKCMRFLCL